MATTVQSTRNLVGMQSIAFIRAISLTLRLSSARPTTPMNVFFDGVLVNQYCAPQGGSLGQSLVSDDTGAITIIFQIPGGMFATGTKQIIVTDSSGINSLSTGGSTFGSARANFTSTGIAQVFQEQTINTQLNTVVVEQVLPTPPQEIESSLGNSDPVDPLAQSFFTYGIKGGCYLTSIDLFFETKDTKLPVRVDIRPMINGFPQSFDPRNPLYASVVSAANVNTSANASLATNFKFEKPIYLEENRDYCFVVFSNSKNYNLYTSKLGEKSLETGKVIFEQPYAGSMFKSENNITWQPEQFEDIKFNLNIAKFDTAINGVVKLKAMSDFFGVPSQYVTTEQGSAVVRIEQTVQHGFGTSGETPSKVYIAVDAGATYNGIPAASIAGERSATVIDEYAYSIVADTNASVDGPILTGGQIREIIVDNGGSNFTSAPTVQITRTDGSSGITAIAIAYIVNGSISKIVVTEKGTGYIKAPTITLTGGGGTGVVLVPIIEAGFSINTNKPTNFIVSNIPAYSAPDAKISAKISTTQLNYDGGNLNTYSVAEVLDMSIQGRTYLNTNAVIASSYNEIARIGGNPSTLIDFSMSTTNPNVSPLIDLSNSPSLISYNYKIRSQSVDDLSAETSTGTVAEIILTNAGSGYTTAPDIDLIGGGGSGATAEAILGTSSVSSIVIGSAGTGYTTSPVVVIARTDGSVGTNATATAVLQSTSVASFALTGGGTGYIQAPTVTLNGGGGGTGASVTAVLNAVPIASIDLDAGGTGYLAGNPPTVVFTRVDGTTGTDAIATPIISGGAITGFNITNYGTGYMLPPDISFTGGVGSGAAATAVLPLRSVASLSFVSGGSGYTVPPTLQFNRIDGGSGTNASGDAILSSRGIASVTVNTGGNNYITAPSISFTRGGGQSGTDAVATAYITGKNIVNINVLTSGANYSSAPEVVITRNDGSTGVNAIATSILTNFNSELSVSNGTALSRYVTKKFTLETPSTGINLFSEIYSEQQSGVDWYIRTSKSGTTQNHDDIEWKILSCDVERNRSSKRGEVFDYKFYLYGLQEFDVYDLKCVMRSSNPTKAPEVNNYRAIIVA